MTDAFMANTLKTDLKLKPVLQSQEMLIAVKSYHKVQHFIRVIEVRFWTDDLGLLLQLLIGQGFQTLDLFINTDDKLNISKHLTYEALLLQVFVEIQDFSTMILVEKD